MQEPYGKRIYKESQSLVAYSRRNRRKMFILIGIALLVFFLSLMEKHATQIAQNDCQDQVLFHYKKSGIAKPVDAFHGQSIYWENMRNCLMRKCMDVKGFWKWKEDKHCVVDAQVGPIYNAFKPMKEEPRLTPP